MLLQQPFMYFSSLTLPPPFCVDVELVNKMNRLFTVTFLSATFLAIAKKKCLEVFLDQVVVKF